MRTSLVEPSGIGLSIFEMTVKDLDDVLGLLSHGGLDAGSSHFKAPCLKYGNETILEDIKSSMARRKLC